MSTLSQQADQLLKAACTDGATDIHFYPQEENVIIYFRIHGKRIVHRSIPHSFYKQLLAYFKFNSGMDIGEQRKPQDGTFTFLNEHRSYALRLSTLPTKQIESLAIRIFPLQDNFNLQELFLFPFQLQQLKHLLTRKHGLILITGPTGCGKTTTLYALLENLGKTEAYQAVTLEDPIEKEIDDLLQVQINERSGVTYDVGLKAALRHDPDIIMVGEIREANVATFVHRAALTGHLVLSTLHAKDSYGTIDRLLEMGLSKTDLAQTLICIISLQLIPVIKNGQVIRRAAIFEMLNEDHIQKLLYNKEGHHSFKSFHDLRKKAYAYGFVDKTIFEAN